MDELVSALLMIDYEILRLINVGLGHPSSDQFWLTISHLDRQAWFSFGVLPLGLGSLWYYQRSKLFRVLLVLVVTVGLTDFISYRVVKTLVDRPRPFQNEQIKSWVRKVDNAGGPSFPSNHAANCFAGAVILAGYFSSRRYYFYLFASLVALSRVALGVHYPSDVLAGAMLGAFIAFWIRAIVIMRSPWLSLSDEN